MALTDAAIRNSKPQTKPYTLKDIQGLTLYVTPNGNKSWHFRYTFEGKRNRVSLGQYPDICLKSARERCEDARFLVKNGFPPTKNHDIEINENGEVEKVTVVTESFAEFSERWKAFTFRKLGLDTRFSRQSTHIQIERYLRKDMLPQLGKLSMNEITKQDVLRVLRKIEMRGALSIAEKARVWLNELFGFSLAEGIIECNPAAEMHILALPKKPTENNPYLTMQELPEFLARLEHYQGSVQTKLGIQLLLLTGVRTGELRQARAEHFDLENQLWCIPPEHVKQLRKLVVSSKKKVPPYLVPLSEQAVAIVKQLLAFQHPRQVYLLCHTYDPRLMMSENTLNSGIKRMGYKDRLTGHGLHNKQSVMLYRFESGHSLNLDQENVSFLIKSDSGDLQGFVRLRPAYASSSPQVSKEEALNITQAFLEKYAPDLLVNYKNDWIDKHNEVIVVVGKRVTLAGMKVKCRDLNTGLYFWTVIAPDQSVMVFERDVEWDFIKAGRPSEDLPSSMGYQTRLFICT